MNIFLNILNASYFIAGFYCNNMVSGYLHFRIVRVNYFSQNTPKKTHRIYVCDKVT